MTNEERRPYRAGGAPSESISRRHSADHYTEQSSAFVVPAVAFPPAPGRRLTLAIVVCCPFCSEGAVSSVHAHRGVTDGSVRRSGCGRGRYVLRVVPGVLA